MNNPFGLMQALMNPQAFIQNAMRNSQIMQNPMAKNALELYQKGDNEGLKQMAENLCKERGTTPDEVRNMILSRMGFQK